MTHVYIPERMTIDVKESKKQEEKQNKIEKEEKIQELAKTIISHSLHFPPTKTHDGLVKEAFFLAEAFIKEVERREASINNLT